MNTADVKRFLKTMKRSRPRPVIEEIISQPDWAAGNALVFIISDDPCNPSEGNRCAEAGPGNDSALLHVVAISEAARNPSPADGAIDVAQDTLIRKLFDNGFLDHRPWPSCGKFTEYVLARDPFCCGCGARPELSVSHDLSQRAFVRKLS